MKMTAEEQNELFKMILPHVEEYAERTITKLLMQTESIINDEMKFDYFLKAFEKAVHESENVNLFKTTTFIEAYEYEKELEIKIAKARAIRAARQVKAENK
jgi:hypothetical protein